MKIVILDGHALNPGDLDWTPLAEIGELEVYDSTSDADIGQRVAHADIVLVNKTILGKQQLAALAGCKMIGVLATGANNLDLPALASAGIWVCNVPAYAVEDVAQHAMAMLLELCRHTCEHSQSIKAGEWQRKGSWCYWLTTPRSLYGQTLGLIGFGAIGQATGRIGSAMGMKILAWARHRKAETAYAFEWASIEDIFKNADVISLHVPLTKETKNLVNAENIALMKADGIIINTARGGLVDEEAVAKALKSGFLAGYGADVLQKEPPDKPSPLFDCPNVLLTPHIAWATSRARKRIIEIMAANIRAFLNGQPQNVIARADS